MTPKKKAATPKPPKNPKVRAIAGKVTAIAVRAAALRIGGREGYKEAAKILQQAKAYQKELTGIRTAVRQALDRGKADALAQFDPTLEKLAIVERSIKDAMLAFDAKESAIIAKEQAKLDRATNKKRDRILARAALARSAGKDEKAEELESEARDVISPTLAPAAPKVKGIAVRRNWTYDIPDEALLPREYMMPHRLKINTVVQALGDLANIPGVIVTEVKDIASKAA